MGKVNQSSIVGKFFGLVAALLLTTSALLAQITITGKVTDTKKEPIIGANIIIKGTTKGGMTDIDGVYKISVPSESSVLQISYIGYSSKDIPVGTKKTINIVLEENVINLNEVVAIGYGSAKKDDLTGAVAKVDMSELSKANVTSFDQALGGRIAGVHVVSGDGRPGSEASIVIRGSNTISDSSDGNPLYVIDGFPTEDMNSSAFNTNDIESIDVLKDASATAIYGARGANGVIIITTKRGAESAPRVSYDGYVSYQEQPKFLDVMNGYDFVKLQTELMTSATDQQYMYDKYYFKYDDALGRNRTLEDYRTIPSVQWQDQIYRGAPMHSHHLSLTGGTKMTKYSASVSYQDQQGIIDKSSFNSLKARATLDQQITKNIKTGITLNFANNNSIGSAPSQGGGSTSQYFLYSVLGYRPVSYSSDQDLINDMYDEAVDSSNDYRYNPIKTIQNQYSKNISRQLNLNAYLSWEIIKGLEFKGTFSSSMRTDKSEAFNNSKTYWGDPVYQANKVNGSFSYREWDGWNSDFTLTYRKKYGQHNFMGMVGTALNSMTNTVRGSQSIMIPWEELGMWGIDSGTPKSITATKRKDNMLSYFARFNYDWRSRYLFTATMRADGSSKFVYNKWGYFPSGSAAWRISEEGFMEGTHGWLNNLKIRGGWGATGNNGTYNSNPSQLLYGYDNYGFGNSMNPALYYHQMANRNLKWETTYQGNIGVDFGLFGNRLSGEIDIYQKNTSNLLLYADTPGSIGFIEVQQNVGSIQNRGLEIALNSVNLKGGKDKLKWTTNFNISFNKNKVTALSNNQESRIVGIKSPVVSDLYICKVGQPLSEMYGYIFDGVYQYTDFNEVTPGNFILKDGIPNNTKERFNIQPGDPKFRDINKDGIVNEADRTVIGHGLPIHTGGITNKFEYKGFDLSFFFQWSYGNDAINYNRALLESVSSKHTNQMASAADHWTPRIVNADGTITEGNYTNYLWRVNSDLKLNTDRVVEDASFLRLKNVQLGYNFPNKWLKKAKIRNLRVYVSGQNLYTWTAYTGYDPEVSTRNSSLTRGFDYSSYPRTRSYTFGVKFSL